jgi:hypothetical protein
VEGCDRVPDRTCPPVDVDAPVRDALALLDGIAGFDLTPERNESVALLALIAGAGRQSRAGRLTRSPLGAS